MLDRKLEVTTLHGEEVKVGESAEQSMHVKIAVPLTAQMSNTSQLGRLIKKTKERLMLACFQVDKAASINHYTLHNINSFLYLGYIIDVMTMLKFELDIKSINNLKRDFETNLSSKHFSEDLFIKYNPEKSYGDIYRRFKKNFRADFEKINSHLDTLTAKTSKSFTQSDLNYLFVIESLVLNRGELLKFIGHCIADPDDPVLPTDKKDFPKRIRSNSIEYTAKSKYTGVIVEESWKKSLPFNFRPEERTSLISVREYDYQFRADDSSEIQSSVQKFTELRMGTQVQLDDWFRLGKPRLNPSFELFLKIQEIEKTHDLTQSFPQDLKHESQKKSPITHVYFNNLMRDRTSSYGVLLRSYACILNPLCAFIAMVLTAKNYARDIFESKITKALDAEEKNKSNLAVITLPADCDMLSQKDINKKNPEIKFSHACKTMLTIANATSKKQITDFYISSKIKCIIYGKDPHGKNEMHDIIKENKELKILLANSFTKIIGANYRNKLLSKAQVQAVYFHFMKYELSNFILNKLKPKTFNMSCKDGIDRGGVSSAYFNLVKSIEEGNPLAEEEFMRALHAGAIIVKGRPLNHQAKIIWNGINEYVKANINKVPPWLVKWTLQHDEVFIKELKHITYPSIFCRGNRQQQFGANKILRCINQSISSKLNKDELTDLNLSEHYIQKLKYLGMSEIEEKPRQLKGFR